MSAELLEDYGGEGFQREIAKIFATEFLTFAGSATLTATGTGQPSGIFTQLYNTTTNPAHIVATTLGTLGLVDIRNAWKALPDKIRGNAVWVMSPTALSAIRSAENGGQALAELSYSGQGTPLLMGRPVVESQYAPAFTATTGTSAQLLTLVDVADGFVWANRVPTIVELTQSAQLPGATPTIQHFLISAPRVAFGLLDPLFGVILANS